MTHILIIAPVPKSIITQLLQYETVVEYKPEIAYQELKTCIHLYDGLIFSTRIPLDKRLLQNASKLKWMGRLGSGLDHVDCNYATEKNIAIITTPEGNSPAVGEHVLCVILSLLHNIVKANTELKQGQWTRNQNTPSEIRGKTIGIVGVGHTGTAVANALQHLGCRLIAYDKYKTEICNLAQPVNMDMLLAQSDVITFHVPLTEETKNMINQSLFSRMQRQPLLINASRGEVLVLTDLIEALNQKKIKGAAIDVFENEDWNTLTQKQQDELHQLSQFSNVILTPHIAGVSHEAKLRMPQLLIEKLVQGKWL